MKWAQPKFGPLPRQIFEPYLDDLLRLYKDHQVRDAATSKCRIRILINGDEWDKANITLHNIFAPLMFIGKEVDAFFSMIHASFDTDDHMPVAPTWFDATLEDEKMLQPFLDAWARTQFDWTQIDIVKFQPYDDSNPA